jgi:hypothetical protein
MHQDSKPRSAPDSGSVKVGSCHVQPIAAFLLRLSCVVTVACILWPNAVWSADEEGHGGLPHHHVAVIAGGTVPVSL